MAEPTPHLIPPPHRRRSVIGDPGAGLSSCGPFGTCSAAEEVGEVGAFGHGRKTGAQSAGDADEQLGSRSAGGVGAGVGGVKDKRWANGVGDAAEDSAKPAWDAGLGTSVAFENEGKPGGDGTSEG